MVRMRIIFALIFGLCFGLLTIELFLRTGLLDNDYRWTPVRFQKIDAEINRSHFQTAAQNRFKFNDIDFSMEKPPHVKRIALIGDSFIFGDGVPYDQIWGVKLRKLITEERKDVEVLLWGKNGWSTKGELKFLKETGIFFKPDLLIVGFVANDPSPCDFDSYCQHWHSWQHDPFLAPLRHVFPESINFISAFADRIHEQNSATAGYDNYESSLYSEKNLSSYLGTLKELSLFCREHGVPVLVVLTPNDYSSHFDQVYSKIKPLMAKAGLSVLDLLPAMRKEFSAMPMHDLWASRANAHPGPRVTDLYAREVFKHLSTEWAAARHTAPQISPSLRLESRETGLKSRAERIPAIRPSAF